MTGLIFSLVSVLYIQCPTSQLEVWRYDTYRKSITVCQNYEEDNYVLFHELYHHVRTLLSEEEKELRTKNINYGWRYASKYARTTYEEWFAETGRVYLQNKGKIRRYNKKLRFVKEITDKYLPELK